MGVHFKLLPANVVREDQVTGIFDGVNGAPPEDEAMELQGLEV